MRGKGGDLEGNKLPQEVHEKCQEQEVVIKKKDKLITRFQSEVMALTKEYLQKQDIVKTRDSRK